jgi:type II secretory pathway pseudopilin PulG
MRKELANVRAEGRRKNLDLPCRLSGASTFGFSLIELLVVMAISRF